MAADLSKRIVVRVTDAQDDWLTQAAADEGLDKATFLRAMVDRLSKGRAPLISMMQSRPMPRAAVLPGGFDPRPGAINYADDVEQSANAVDAAADLAQRAAEDAIANAPRVKSFEELNPPRAFDATEPDPGVVSMPLRRVGRQVYNPGRN